MVICIEYTMGVHLNKQHTVFVKSLSGWGITKVPGNLNVTSSLSTFYSATLGSRLGSKSPVGLIHTKYNWLIVRFSKMKIVCLLSASNDEENELKQARRNYITDRLAAQSSSTVECSRNTPHTSVAWMLMTYATVIKCSWSFVSTEHSPYRRAQQTVRSHSVYALQRTHSKCYADPVSDVG